MHSLKDEEALDQEKRQPVSGRDQAPANWKSWTGRTADKNVVVQIPDRCLARVGADFRGNLGLGVGVGIDVCVCLAFGLSDGVAVTVVVGVGVGLAVAVERSTLLSLASRSVWAWAEVWAN